MQAVPDRARDAAGPRGGQGLWPPPLPPPPNTGTLLLILLRSYDWVAQRDVAIKVIDLEDMCEPA